MVKSYSDSCRICGPYRHLLSGCAPDAGVNEITVSLSQLAAMEADPRLVVTVLAAAAEQLADDDAAAERGVDFGLDGLA